MLTYSTCRVCGNGQLSFSGKLGMLPQMNFCSKSEEEAKNLEKIPINLHFCQHCYHLQLGESFSPEETFRTYSYATQFTPSIQRHGGRIVDWLSSKYGIPKKSFIVEVASNDGAILRSFVRAGYRNVLGIEPARNIANIARGNGIRTESEFFSRDYAAHIAKRYGNTGIVLARHVLAHVPATVDFLQGVRDLLAPNGIFCVETPYIRNLIDYMAFDSVYHEHLSYYLVSTLKYLLGRAGLEVIDIEETNIHTGSILVFAKRVESPMPVSPKINGFIEEERKQGYFKKEIYRAFVKTCRKRIMDIRRYLLRLRKKDGPLAGYGAAAKTNVLLNLARVPPSVINVVVDRNPLKSNTWAPGSGIPIKSVRNLTNTSHKHVILFAWNFADEILAENRHLLKRGTQFHVLIPKPMRITLDSIRQKGGFKFYRSLEAYQPSGK